MDLYRATTSVVSAAHCLSLGRLRTMTKGSPLHAGDMRAQFGQAIDNLETVLKQAGLALENVVRLNYYTTDVDKFMEAADVAGERLGKAGCRPASTLLGVSRLAFPQLMIEIEATAVE